MRPPLVSLASTSRAPHDGTRADSVRAVTGTGKRLGGRLTDLAAVVVGAAVLRLIAGVGFANYDTLYALAWGGQLAQGETPAYGVPISPTPHPLIELLGIVLRPLSPHAEIQVAVWLGFLALAGCGVVIFRLGEAWWGAAAGALARAAVPDAGARDLLRRARLPRRAVRAAGAGGAAGRGATPAGGSAGARAAGAGRAAPPGGLGVLGSVLAVSRRAAAGLAARAPAARRAGASPRPAGAADAAGGRGAADLAPQRPGDHGPAAVVADAHARHGLRARPQDGDRQRPAVRAAPDRRGAAGGRACGRGGRGGALAAVAAPPGARPGSGGRAGGRDLRSLRVPRAPDQHALRVPRLGFRLPVLRSGGVRLDVVGAGRPAARRRGSRPARSSPSR